MNIEPMKPTVLGTSLDIDAAAVAAPPNRHAVRAAEYRTIAAQALSAAETSGLPHVREKFVRSAQVWIEMARADELRAHPSAVAR